MGWSGKPTRIAWTLLVAVACALACGGGTAQDGNQAPSTTPMRCFEGDVVYAHGHAVSSDACRTCTCLDGSIVCKDVCGPRDCVAEGMTYKPGERFVDRDGCYDCTCQTDGSLACTLVCRACGSVEPEFAMALRQAQVCDPSGENQCTQLVVTSLGCECQGFVNPVNAEAVAKLSALHAEYADLGCAEGSSCPACSTATEGFCLNGRCEGIWDAGSCKVSGVAYADGATGIGDATSCNLCECQSGQLACTEENCPEPCMVGTVLAEACLMCGDVGGCALTDRACFPECDESCPIGQCEDRACVGGLMGCL